MRAELFSGASGRRERSRPKKTRIEESEEEERGLFRPDEVGQKQLGEEVGQEGGESGEAGENDEAGDDEDAYGGMLR